MVFNKQVQPLKRVKKKLINTSLDTNHKFITDIKSLFKTNLDSYLYLDLKTKSNIKQDLDSKGKFLQQRIDYHEVVKKTKQLV